MNIEKKSRLGWYIYDWANSAFPTTVITLFLGPYITDIAQNASAGTGFINVFGLSVAAGSYFPYLVAISVLFQVLFLPLAGAIADYTNQKKLLLAFFTALGSFSTSMLFFLQGDNYLFGGLMFIIANLSFGIAMVLYNAFLNDISIASERDKVSSIGWAFGYLGGGTLLALNLALFSSADMNGITKSLAVRICLSSAGIWWGLFSIITFLLIKQKKSVASQINKKNLLTVGYAQLKKTFKDAKNYPKALTFLIAYLFFNDGVQAVIALSAQFGQEELGISLQYLTIVILIVQFVAFIGALTFKQISQWFGSKKALIISLLIWIAAIIYSYAFLFTESDFMLLGIIIGLVLGGTQAISRSIYSQLIPEGAEAEYFSLYEISERGTSWMAPLIFGLVFQFTGSYRLAIFSLMLFFIIGLVLFIKLKFDNKPNP